MPVVALPDILGAIVARLRAVTEITALTSTRISPVRQESWNPMPRHAIWVDGPKGMGPFGSDNLPLETVRVDLNCFGSTDYEAGRLWRTMHSAICPYQGAATQFVAAGVRVSNVQRESGPIRFTDSDTGWPCVIGGYLFSYQGAS